MSVCMARGHILVRIERKFETIYYLNKFKLRGMNYQQAGPGKLWIL